VSVRSALLLLNGELRESAVVRALARRVDIVVCADGGARHAISLRLVPDAVVGDMDSVPRRLPPSWHRVSFIHVPDVASGDLDKSLDYVEEIGIKTVWIAGALGGGLDHELVNLAALETRGKKLDIAVVGGGLARLLGPGRHALPLRRGERFSLLAAPRANVTLTGARYGLRRETLTRGSRGLGNRAEGRATLTVHSGQVWLAIDAGRVPG
jgi:thiamine pyrophosphokinase